MGSERGGCSPAWRWRALLGCLLVCPAGHQQNCWPDKLWMFLGKSSEMAHSYFTKDRHGLSCPNALPTSRLSLCLQGTEVPPALSPPWSMCSLRQKLSVPQCQAAGKGSPAPASSSRAVLHSLPG